MDSGHNLLKRGERGTAATQLHTAVAERLFGSWFTRHAFLPLSSTAHTMPMVGMTLNPCLICFYMPKDVWYGCLFAVRATHA